MKALGGGGAEKAVHANIEAIIKRKTLSLRILPPQREVVFRNTISY
jgi:hypothetical protein